MKKLNENKINNNKNERREKIKSIDQQININNNFNLYNYIKTFNYNNEAEGIYKEIRKNECMNQRINFFLKNRKYWINLISVSPLIMEKKEIHKKNLFFLIINEEALIKFIQPFLLFEEN